MFILSVANEVCGLNGLQWINAFLFVVVLIGSVYWALKNHGRQFYSVPTILLAIHGIAFYVFYAVQSSSNKFDVELFNYWSQALRLQGSLTVIMLLLVVDMIRKGKE